MSGRVLVIEPEDLRYRGEIGAALRAEGLVVEETDDARTGIADAAAGGYDLVVFDPGAPGLGGLQGCRRLRLTSDASLLIVSAHDSEADRVGGFDAGADDFLGAPFSTAELVSRVRALLRRRQLDLRPPEPLLRVGDLEVDRVSRSVRMGGVPLSLTPTEFRLLAFLAEDPGRVYAAAEILRVLWQSDHVPYTGACKAHISNLRQKLERDPSRPERIVTVRGVGYRLVAR
jgi:two-component system response regulator RegX3